MTNLTRERLEDGLAKLNEIGSAGSIFEIGEDLIREALTALLEDQWQDIDTCPQNELVFVGAYIDGVFQFYKSEQFFDKGNELEGEYYSGWVFSQDDGCIEDRELTHWKPSPKPPETK